MLKKRKKAGAKERECKIRNQLEKKKNEGRKAEREKQRKAIFKQKRQERKRKTFGKKTIESKKIMN